MNSCMWKKTIEPSSASDLFRMETEGPAPGDPHSHTCITLRCTPSPFQRSEVTWEPCSCRCMEDMMWATEQPKWSVVFFFSLPFCKVF